MACTRFHRRDIVAGAAFAAPQQNSHQLVGDSGGECALGSLLHSCIAPGIVFLLMPQKSPSSSESSLPLHRPAILPLEMSGSRLKEGKVTRSLSTPCPFSSASEELTSSETHVNGHSYLFWRRGIKSVLRPGSTKMREERSRTPHGFVGGAFGACGSSTASASGASSASPCQGCTNQTTACAASTVRKDSRRAWVG